MASVGPKLYSAWQPGFGAQLVLETPGRRYLLADYFLPPAGWRWPILSPEAAGGATAVALALNPGLIGVMRSRLGTFDGYASANKIADTAVAARVADLVRRKRLIMFDMGTPLVRVDAIVQGPAADELRGLDFADKAMTVVQGLADVEPAALGSHARQALVELKDAMTSSPALISTMVFVFATWVASQATGVLGLALDAALFGFVLYQMGMSAFGWFERLAGLVKAIYDARTRGDLKKCSEELARLIVEIGVGVFVTLLTKAAGKAVKATAKKVIAKASGGGGGGPAPKPPAAQQQPAKPRPTTTKKLPPSKDPRYKRGKFRKGVRDQVWDNAKGPDGKVRDPVTGKVMSKDEPWQMGHKPGYEHRKHQKSASERDIGRDEFLDEFNDPEHYRPELPESNMSHKGEDMSDDYFGD